jgi:[acyl-carrier-protein] S-malonyltransferase
MTTAVIFTGQGAQRPGMAAPWLEHPVSEAILSDAAGLLGYDLVEECGSLASLNRTEVTQPALFVCGIAAYRVLQSRGIAPVAVAGHSIGEFTALVAAGVLDFAAALEVVRIRATAMAEAAAACPGAMTAVLGPDAFHLAARAVASVPGYRDEVLVMANDNGPDQVVLSGTTWAVGQAEELVRQEGGRTRRLNVAGAFHSPLMEAAAQRVEQALAGLTWREPEAWVIPNVTGEPTRDPRLLARLLRRHLLSTVRWTDTNRALGTLGVTRVVECGPAAVLSAIGRRVLPAAEFQLASSPSSALAAFESRTPVA